MLPAQAMLNSVSSAVARVARASSLSDAGGNSSKGEADVANRKLKALQGELDSYACKLDGFKHAVQELELQVASRDKQVAALQAAIASSPDHLRPQLAQALREAEQLKQQLGAANQELAASRRRVQQLQAQATDGRLPALGQPLELDAVCAALAEANRQLQAAGRNPITPLSSIALTRASSASSASSSLSLPSEGNGYLHIQAPFARMTSTAASGGQHCSHDTCGGSESGDQPRQGSIEAPATPLSPGEAGSAAPNPVLASMRHGSNNSSVLGPDGHPDAAQPHLSLAVMEPAVDDDEAVQRACLPGAKLYSEPVSPAASCSTMGDHAYEGDRRQTTQQLLVNPLFRRSESRSAAPSARVSVDAWTLGAGPARTPRDSVATVGGLCSDVHQQCVLVKAQLEIQLQQSENQLAQVASLASVASNQARSAHSRIKHSIRSQRQLYELLKALMEDASAGPLPQQVLQRKLAEGINELAALATYQREMAGCVEALRKLLAKMEQEGRPLDSPGATQ